jgi:hypothetical protein
MIPGVPGRPTAILLGCVKSKLDHRAQARDLYCSALWRDRRAYAEASGLPWLILSAKYRLVDPHRLLHPYDLALGDLSASKRGKWGERVVDSLEERFNSLEGATFEVHAGAAYRNAIDEPLARRAASLTVPLVGLTLGEQLRWYAKQGGPVPRRNATAAEVRRALHDIDEAPDRIAASDWPADLCGLDQPGLYSWWVDAAGAKNLSRGLGHQVKAGRICAGQTGATKWPSGTTGKATLATRIGGNHLRGRIRSSTFRLTLASALAGPLALARESPRRLDSASEKRLSAWMRKHMQVAVHPFPDRDALGDLEDQVLARLHPPLNLDGMPPTPLREALSRRRREIQDTSRREAPRAAAVGQVLTL